MKIHPQTIYKGDKAEYVVLPIDDYNRLIEALEDQYDIEEIKRHFAKVSETFPVELIKALSDGENPIKVYREYRGINQSALAKKANVSRQYISQLEKGERKGTPKVLQSIANILKVELEDLIGV